MRARRHVTEAVGGVSWSDQSAGRAVVLPLPIASAVVAAPLSWLTERMRARGPPGPIRASVRARLTGSPDRR